MSVRVRIYHDTPEEKLKMGLGRRGAVTGLIAILERDHETGAYMHTKHLRIVVTKCTM